MTLKNGSFYKDDIKVPAEFGNKEQVQLINRHQELCSKGVVAYVYEYEKVFVITYTCLCGNQLRRHHIISKWNENPKDNFFCKECRLEYELDGEELSPMVLIKLVMQKK